MIRDKRKLQLYTATTLTALLVAMGFIWATHALALYRSTMMRQIAEDNEIVKANLNIIIHQVTKQYADRDMVITQIQNVLDELQSKGWNGFACVLDKDGRVLAHPNRQMVDMQVPLQTYEPLDLFGILPPPIDRLQDAPNPKGDIYRTQADIIAIDWLPDLMTYLCVHKSHHPITEKANALRRRLISVGLFIVSLAATGAWFFVGWLVERYESDLARSETRNRTLVQNSAPIVITTPNGAILDVNAEAEALLNAQRDHLLNRDLSQWWPAAYRSDLEALLQVKPDAPEERRDLDISTATEKAVPVDVRTCRITYGDRDAIYFLIRDVSETRKAREEILEANRKLEELDQLKTDFINTVSHELRTPLTSIRWSAESLSDLLPGNDATVLKLLKIIKDDNLRLSNHIEELLSFSRLDAGRLRPNITDVDLAQIARSTRDEVAFLAKKKGINLTLDVPGALPIRADSEQLHRVVTNLLDNAIKYTPPDGTVAMRLSQTPQSTILAVSDSGIGIPGEDIPHIFDKFYRTDQAGVLRERGTGLGLAIVKGIVEAHGGTIGVHSAVGEGTTMTIRLPAPA